MRRSDEDIIITSTGEMQQAIALAKKVSHSRNHSWANLWYIDSQTKKLTRATYLEGKYYTSISGDINFWFSAGQKRGLTILDAMVRYGRGWVKANARRLGGTGEYSSY